MNCKAPDDKKEDQEKQNFVNLKFNTTKKVKKFLSKNVQNPIENNEGGRDNFKCSFCGKIFITELNLNKHIFVHVDNNGEAARRHLELTELNRNRKNIKNRTEDLVSDRITTTQKSESKFSISESNITKNIGSPEFLPLQKIQQILPQISVTQSIELCQICGMSYKTQNELKNHIAVIHEPKMNPSESEMAKREPNLAKSETNSTKNESNIKNSESDITKNESGLTKSRPYANYKLDNAKLQALTQGNHLQVTKVLPNIKLFKCDFCHINFDNYLNLAIHKRNSTQCMNYVPKKSVTVIAPPINLPKLQILPAKNTQKTIAKNAPPPLLLQLQEENPKKAVRKNAPPVLLSKLPQITNNKENENQELPPKLPEVAKNAPPLLLPKLPTKIIPPITTTTENDNQCYFCGNMFKITNIQAHMQSIHKTYSKTMHGPKRAQNLDLLSKVKNLKNIVMEENAKKIDMSIKPLDPNKNLNLQNNGMNNLKYSISKEKVENQRSSIVVDIQGKENNAKISQNKPSIIWSQNLSRNQKIVLPNQNQNPKCDKCGIYFSTRGKLNVHMMDFHSTNKLNLKKVNNLHDMQENKLKCEICNVTFQHEDSLAYHKLNDHPSSTKVKKAGNFKCTFCGKIFITELNLNKHIFVHVGVLPLPPLD